MKLIVPAIKADIKKIIDHSEYFYKFLPISSITVIGDSSIEDMAYENGLEYIEESSLVDYKSVSNYIYKRTNNYNDVKRTGWYVQQFIKMAYSLICRDDYYLLWDSDTIPLKKVAFMIENKPVFDCKTEHHKPYFNTISNLFPEFELSFHKSFIAEHMLIKTEIMRMLIKDIESSQCVDGENFQQKIINSIDICELGRSGYSEFETFGNYVRNRYPDSYRMRDWRSLRHGGFFFDGTSKIDCNVLQWLSNYFDAISFEKGDSYSSRCFRMMMFLHFHRLNPRYINGVAFYKRMIRMIKRKTGRDA